MDEFIAQLIRAAPSRLLSPLTNVSRFRLSNPGFDVADDELR
jgi:hypothetical protein